MRRLLFVFAVTLSVAFAQTAPSRGQVPAPKTAVVTGQVISTGGGEPIAKADVMLIKDSDNQQASGARKLETDLHGAFRFDRVLPGRYILAARLSGYIGTRGGDSSSVVLALNAGDEERQILRLVPTPVVVGRVRDEDGVPLREAQVKVVGQTSKGLRVLRTAVTDERGEYRLYGFPPGKHLVCAVFHDRRKTDMRYPPSCFPDVSDIDDAAPIRFDAGQETSLNFTMFPARAITVHGVVTGVPMVGSDSGPRLITGVHIKLEPKWQTVVDDKHEAGAQQASGNFDLPGVIPGMYTATATAITPRQTLAFRDTVEIKETDDTWLVLPLTPVHDEPVSVTYMIGYEGLRETFPLNRVSIEFRATRSPEHQDGWLPSPSHSNCEAAVWGKEGKSFPVEARCHATLEVGYNYVPVLVTAPAGAYLRSSFLQGRREITSAGFKPTGNELLELFLSKDAASIEGDVIDADGKPVADAIVIGAPDADTGEPTRTASDQNGHFVLHGIAPGDYRLYSFDSLGMEQTATREFLQPFAGLSDEARATRKNNGDKIVLKLIHVDEDGD